MKGLYVNAFRYGLATSVSFLASIMLTVFLHEVIRLAEESAYGATLVTISLINFFVCRDYVFESKDPRIFSQMVSFFCSWATFRVTEFVTFLLVHTWLGANYVLAIVGIQGTSFVLKFFWFRRFVFGVGSDQTPVCAQQNIKQILDR